MDETEKSKVIHFWKLTIPGGGAHGLGIRLVCDLGGWQYFSAWFIIQTALQEVVSIIGAFQNPPTFGEYL